MDINAGPDHNEFKLEVDRLDENARVSRDALNGKLREWAKLCPHKPGDLLTIPRGASTGVGRQCRVVSAAVVRARYTMTDTWTWRIHGMVMKKDGTPSSAGMLSTVFEMPIEF